MVKTRCGVAVTTAPRRTPVTPGLCPSDPDLRCPSGPDGSGHLTEVGPAGPGHVWLAWLRGTPPSVMPAVWPPSEPPSPRRPRQAPSRGRTSRPSARPSVRPSVVPPCCRCCFWSCCERGEQVSLPDPGLRSSSGLCPGAEVRGPRQFCLSFRALPPGFRSSRPVVHSRRRAEGPAFPRPRQHRSGFCSEPSECEVLPCGGFDLGFPGDQFRETCAYWLFMYLLGGNVGFMPFAHF